MRQKPTAVATLSGAAEPGGGGHGGAAAMGLLCEIFVSRADRRPVGQAGQCSLKDVVATGRELRAGTEIYRRGEKSP